MYRPVSLCFWDCAAVETVVVEGAHFILLGLGGMLKTFAAVLGDADNLVRSEVNLISLGLSGRRCNEICIRTIRG